MKLGIERLLEEPALRKPLAGRRVALLAHPASVTRDLTHSLDALATLPALRLTAQGFLRGTAPGFAVVIVPAQIAEPGERFLIGQPCDLSEAQALGRAGEEEVLRHHQIRC